MSLPDAHSRFSVYQYGKTNVLHYYARNLRVASHDAMHELGRAKQMDLTLFRTSIEEQRREKTKYATDADLAHNFQRNIQRQAGFIRRWFIVVVRLPEISFIDNKESKPIGINLHIGHRPIFAAGNSDGAWQMLQYATIDHTPSFGLIVHDTDEKREWAYDRNSHIGKLDKALNDAKPVDGPLSI